MIGVGEGPSTTMTDFKMAPETSRPKNFTPLPDFREPTMTEPQKYQEPTATSQIDQLMADILAQGKDNNPQTAIKQMEKNLPQKTEKPQRSWNWSVEDIKNFIKNFFKNLFR